MQEAGVPVNIILALIGAVLLIHVAVRMTRSAAAAAIADPEASEHGGLRRDERWFWRRADELVARGAYGPAMLAAFHASMLSFDRRGLLAYRASATPRELLARTRIDAVRRDRLTLLLGALYRTAFASEPISPDDYQGWVRDLREVSDAPAA
jgi:hypothetical protein